jgi:hypothetical protein
LSIESDLVKDARDQLSLVLSFFPRVDAKLSTVLAVDTALLATMSATVPSFRQIDVLSWIASTVTVILLVLSFFHLYRGGFPNTKGGHSSLIYFREIAARTEARFLEAYICETPQGFRADLLAQVWRNSEILAAKYDHLKLAFIFMASALLPWAATLAMFSFDKQSLHVTMGS